MGKMLNVTLAWRVSCRQWVGWRKGLWEGVMEVHAFGQGVVGRARRDVISLLSETKIPDSLSRNLRWFSTIVFWNTGWDIRLCTRYTRIGSVCGGVSWFSRPYEERWGQRVAFYLLRRVHRVSWLLGEGWIKIAACMKVDERCVKWD